MAAVNCTVCGKPIPAERLEALPDTRQCVKCSTVKPVRGLMEYGHKTAGTIVMLPDDEEQVRLAYRAFRRAR